MFFYSTHGSPYEMGKQTGQAAALAIGSMLDYLTRQFRDWDLKKFEEIRRERMAYTEKIYPELVEEIQGIADGSGFPFHLIYLMNFYAVIRPGKESCSNIIFPNTPDGPLLAKTNDLPVNEGHRSGVRRIVPDNGPALLGSTFPGTVWCAPALNELGLAMGASSCAARVDAPADMLSPHVLTRYVLSRAGTTQEALAVLESVDIPPWGLNLALVDRSGDAVIVEKAGTHQSVRRANGAPIFCTNHSCADAMSEYAIHSPAVMTESHDRFNAIGNIIHRGEPGVGLLKKVVAFAEQPGAVCRSGDVDPLGYETEFSCILHPAAGKAEFCFSRADRDPWREFPLTAS